MWPILTRLLEISVLAKPRAMGSLVFLTQQILSERWKKWMVSCILVWIAPHPLPNQLNTCLCKVNSIILLIPFIQVLNLILASGKYVGNRPIKLRKSTWTERTDQTALERQKVSLSHPNLLQFLSPVSI